jgi:competence protein ComFC
MINSLHTSYSINKKTSLFWTAIDYLFPPFCCNCGVLGYELCRDCLKKIVVLDQRYICPICGDISTRGKICIACQTNKPFFNQLRSWGIYTGVLKEAIQKIKFNHGLGLPSYFTNVCVEFIKTWGINIDVIAPIPLSKKRLHRRGYNQAALIAKPISKDMHILYRPNAVSRIKETMPQVGLTAKEREDNVFDAFESNPKIVQNKSILVIDDVTTTGSTLNECSKALRNVGAKNIYCFTLARTPFAKNQFEELEAK